MTPTFIGTQQQPWSLWCTNTRLTPCHQGAFIHLGFQGTLTHRHTLESFREIFLPSPNCVQIHPSPHPEQYDAAPYKEGRQPIVCMPGVSCVP